MKIHTEFDKLEESEDTNLLSLVCEDACLLSVVLRFS